MQMSDSHLPHYNNTQNKNISKMLEVEESEKLESSINFDNRNMIQESSVEEIRSNSEATAPNIAEKDTAFHFDDLLEGFKKKKGKHNAHPRRLSATDKDYQKILKMVE